MAALVVEPPEGLGPADPSPEHTVVVRAPDSIGDAVLAIPAIAALAEHFSSHSLVLAANPVVAPLFVGQDRISEVVRISGGGLTRLASARRTLAGRRPALGISLQPSLGAAAELATGGVGEIWGYDGALSRLALDVRLPRRWFDDRHRWEAYALLAAAVTGEPVGERYPIPIGPGDVAAADDLLANDRLRGSDGPLVGLVPGARGRARRWPEERFARVASELARRGARVVLFGTLLGRAITERVVAMSDPQPVDLTGLTPLPVLAECFGRLDAVLTNGSGVAHLAAAVEAPLLALYGPDDDRITGPRGSGSVVFSRGLFCRACEDENCAYNHACMIDHTVTQVVERLSVMVGFA